MNRRTRLLSSLLLLAVLLGVPAVLTWRAVRQERLDRALIAAVKERKADAVVSLLEQGADPNAREHSEQSVTAWQVFRSLFLRLRHGKQPAQPAGNTALTLALDTTAGGIIESGSLIEPRIVAALLEAGANPNCRDNWGWHRTPLYVAVIHCPSLVQPLLEKGANVNVRDEDGYTPLMFASDPVFESDPAVARLLLDRGADVNARDKEGGSVLVNLISSRDDTLETIRLLLDRGAKVNATDKDGWTPLMWAAKLGKTSCVSLLLREHANLDLKDSSGRTAYKIARQQQAWDVAALLKQAGAKE